MSKIKLLTLLFTVIVLFANAQFNVEHYLVEGHRDLMKSNYTSAIHRLNTIIQIKPDLLEAYYFRGFAKYSLGDYTGAFIDFNKVVELNPYFSEGYRFRGITKTAMQDHQDAMEDFNKAISLDLTDPNNYISRGFAYMLVKEYNKALDDFNTAIKQKNDIAHAYLNRGYVKLNLKDNDGAVADFSKAISMNPYEPEGYARRALAFAELEKYTEALADLDQAIKIDQYNTLFYFNRALIKYKAKNIEGTMADYNKVLELDPENGLTYFNRAILKSEIGLNADAIKDYSKAIELSPKNILPFFNRGGVKYELGDYYGAIEDWSQAIEIFPDFAKAYQARSSARYMIGDYLGAKKDKDIARKKIEEYQSSPNSDSTMAQFVDTNYNFKKVIEFDTDFYRASIDDGQIQNQKIVIDLKPVLLITSKHDSLKRENFTFYLQSLEDINLKNQQKITFVVASELTKLNVDSIRILMNYTEQEKIKTGNNAYLLFYQGLLNSMVHNYNQSIKAYSNAILIDPKFELAYFNRANTRYLMIDYLNSLDDYSQVVTIDGQTTAKGGDKKNIDQVYDYTDVVNDLDQAIALNPQFSFAYYNRGNVKCMQRNFTGAIDDYTKSIQVGPAMPQAYYNRGLTLLYLQDNEKGCHDLSKAGELGIEDAYVVIKKYCTKK